MPTAPGFCTCAIEIKHTALARSAFITFGADPTATDPFAIAASVNVAASATGSLKAILDTNCSIIGSRVSLGTDGTEDVVGSATTAVVGLKSVSGIPPNVALLVHKRTARGGRRGRGRFYIPFAVNTAAITEDGRIAPAEVTTLQTAMDTFLTQINTTVGPMVVLHRTSAPGVDHPTNPGPPSTVTGLAVDNLVATQRRRLGR